MASNKGDGAMLNQSLLSHAPAINANLHGRSRPATEADGHDVIALMGASMSFKRNAEIYGEDEPADYVYKVVAGSVRTYKVLADGRRHVGSFYLAGDVFGLELGDEHALSAEAISDAKLLVVKRTALLAMASRDGAVAQQLWAITKQELRRAQNHVLALIKSAEERVVSFLLEMANRCADDNQIILPMSRQDIADYLGLTIETVSRTLTHLENTATIALPTARRVVLRNRGALNRLDG
jgi:CRP-like cAMP-binding protein